MPPFDLPFMLVPMMMVCVWMLDQVNALKQSWGQKLKRCFVVGWFLGFGYFTAGLWWLAYAFLVEPDQFALLIPLGIFGLPAVLAVLPVLLVALPCCFGQRRRRGFSLWPPYWARRNFCAVSS